MFLGLRSFPFRCNHIWCSCKRNSGNLEHDLRSVTLVAENNKETGSEQRSSASPALGTKMLSVAVTNNYIPKCSSNQDSSVLIVT